MRKQIESFLSILYPDDPAIWKVHMAPIGAAEAFAKSGKLAKRGEYITEDVSRSFSCSFLEVLSYLFSS
jgi:soluble epoxide hydrolase/lipid-phosphate phosphatase